ncbi:MAG: N-acetylmuramoyl-L-alanine amidase-like domain-containing protein [Saprospiraceae bacterium]
MRALPIFLLSFSLLSPARYREPAVVIDPVVAVDPVIFDQRDVAVFDEKQKVAASATGKVAQTLAVAQSFLGAPYVTGSLEDPGPEQLIVNLRQLDCWTFLENSLAIALSSQGDFQVYQDQLQQLRYWGGTVNGYGSRIHYFSGWVLQAQALGYLRDLTADIGGIPYRKKVGYISGRPAKYPRIRDTMAFRNIIAAEDRINRHSWSFIPKSKVAQIESQLQEGDLILLTSVKRDLDIAHQGFAVRRNGRIHLLHASSLHKRVIISAEPLAQYMAKQKGQSGIMVVRINY